MDAEKLTTALFEKMTAEQDKYRAWLVTQPPEEILNHAYEYTTRQDILMALEVCELTAPQAEALLASYTPLADIYKDFRLRFMCYSLPAVRPLCGLRPKPAYGRPLAANRIS